MIALISYYKPLTTSTFLLPDAAASFEKTIIEKSNTPNYSID
jgi:hypothetical protein